MKEEPRLSRRSMLATVASGAVLGAIWGAAFPIVASESRPSLAIVGHRGGQLVLADSGEARALVFLGQPDDALIRRIDAMMTLFRQRIDILVGSKAILERRAFALQGRWAVEHAVMMTRTAEKPALAMPTTIVTENAIIDLGHGMALECSVGHRNEWLAGNEDRPTLWMARLTHPSGDVAMVPEAVSLEALGPTASTLLVIPDAAPSMLGIRARARALAVNYDSEMAESDSAAATPLTRIYPQDIARFAFGDDGIELPAWTDTDQPQRPVAVSGTRHR